MKTIPYMTFWDNAHTRAQKRGTLFRVMIELTYRCNFYCEHCYIPKSYREQKEMSTQAVICILDKLKAMGCLYVGFTGGEPFLRNDIFDILWHAKRCGFEVMINTNGFFLNNEVVAELSRMRLNKIDITIHSLDHAVFDTITGVTGAGDTVFLAFDYLMAQGIPVAIKTCVLPNNRNDIISIRRFAEQHHMLHRIEDALMPRLDGSLSAPAEESDRICSAHEKILIKSISDAAKHDTLCSSHTGFPAPRGREVLFTCGVGKFQAAITPQGVLKPCLMLPEPHYELICNDLCGNSDAVGENLEQSWAHMKLDLNRISQQTFDCLDCVHASVCRWCPARAWLHTKTFTTCIVPRYAMAGSHERKNV